MAVAPVVRKDRVLWLQRPGDRDADELLTDAGVHGAEQLALAEQLEQALLGPADQQRLAQLVGIAVERVVRHGRFELDGDVVVLVFHRGPRHFQA